jgi:hypothetical protein
VARFETLLPHKKGRGGRKKVKIREIEGKRYPHKMERCTTNIAPNCKIWVNINTMPVLGICKRCWQKLNSG